MKLARLYMVELPFVLNLPNGDYTVQLDGQAVLLEVLQNQFAVPTKSVEKSDFRVGSLEELSAIFGESWKQAFRFPLRTIIRMWTNVEIHASEVKTATENDIADEYATQMIVGGRATAVGDALIAEAKEALKVLTPEEHNQLADSTAKRLTAKAKFPNRQVELFHRAVNALIRLYMTHFGDWFVEEVTLHQLGNTHLRGIHRSLYFDGEQIDAVTVAGKVPPIMTRPWLAHDPAKVNAFKSQLSAGVQPDTIELLCGRGKGQLERGANRSAIIEASAALETAVERRIKSALKANGKRDAEIEDVLDDTKMNFPTRAEQTLKSSIGKSIGEIDGALWVKVKAHRKNYRHKIAHTDAEPAKEESEKAVNDFTALARAVQHA
jgi:hypothetical protein